MIYHRGPEFREIFREVLDNLQFLFQTRHEVIVLTGSGTGGMEACVCNLLRRDDKVLVIAGGKFGARWTNISRAHRLNTVELEVPWGQSVDLSQLEQHLREDPEIAAVCCTHSETSTGALHDVKAIAKAVRAHSEALMIVDGVTALGVIPFRFDDWHIDACVGGSQKGTLAPPGLAFVALSERAWQRHRESDLPRFYFDFTQAREAAAQGDTAWTPAVTIIQALAESLRTLRRQGLEHAWRHYDRLAATVRAGIKALGLEIFPQNPSNALTAVKVPKGVDGVELVKRLRTEFGITAAGGQGQLKGKIFRLTQMGHYDYFDMVALMAAVELSLARLGWPVQLGAGLTAMQHAYQRDW